MIGSFFRPAARRAVLLGSALVSLSSACKKGSAADEATAKAVVAAKTAKATIEPFSTTRSAIGTVVARPGHYAALSAPSPTRVSKIFVAPGQRVGAGQPLIEFDQATFAAAANAAQAALAAAQRNYDRALRLANEGIVPRKDAETAASDLAKARNDAVTAQRALALSVLRSPVSGVVTRMAAVLGAPADAGQVLVEVADPSAFDVALSLGPNEAADVRPGATVTFTAGEKAGGDPVGTGTVTGVNAAVDTASRSVQIRATVTSPRRPLRLSESVYGVITIQTKPSAVVVPVEALVPGDEPGSYKVFVVDKNGMAIAHDVKVGARTETKAEITDGLSGGETVVTQGAYGLEDSARVARTVPVKP
ncbi:MAG TPA: efflux RND transporter periplasmic adaptor subunit [Gemmatimonadaceae bacterium]|jgi:RND family efflux transporter MFP subunit